MTTDAELPDNLSEWMASQRWYGSKGSEPELDRIGGWSTSNAVLEIHTHYLMDRANSRATLYQVPLTYRTDPLPSVEPIAHEGGRFIYDACTDPAYATTLLDIMHQEADFAPRTSPASAAVRGHRQPGAADVHVTDSAVLKGEQSNTSIICRVSEGNPVIIKVFRALHHGDNPDVVLQSAIAEAGSSVVPLSIGSIQGQWPDTGRDNGIATGHLAFAQEFLPDVEDAWRVALHAAETGEDFTDRARELGETTADVHRILGEVFETTPAIGADIDAIIASMRSRLDLATAEVPSLLGYYASIDSVFEAARHAPWPSLQRIHGDYHLGQVLAVRGRGWVVLDFEGEPMRPMSERSQADITLRDVAGMLRSFDYAAGSVALRGGGDSALAWASAARRAFVDGYIARSGNDVRAHRALLDAFEIDKALYEAVYEARNRPDWIDIPVTAIRRLAERSG